MASKKKVARTARYAIGRAVYNPKKKKGKA